MKEDDDDDDFDLFGSDEEEEDEEVKELSYKFCRCCCNHVETVFVD